MTLTQQYISLYHLAEQTLLQSNISAFPVDPVRLCKKNGVLVTGYEKFSVVSGTPVQELLAISQDGFCMRYQERPIIVYNHDVSSPGRKRWTVLHELSHILLGHIDQQHLNIYERRQDVRRWMEAEADILTKCLIAPLPVALVCHVRDEKELRSLFGLSAEAAQNLYRDYRYLCARRRILALDAEPLLASCPRFFMEWRLKQLELSREQRRSILVTPTPEELKD